MNICFLDNSSVPYDHTFIESNKIRGAERAIINLVLQLDKLGHKVTVINHIKSKIVYRNIRWLNIESYNDTEYFDVAISNNDINNFNIIQSKKKIAISHSIQTIEKFIRKKQLISYIKHRPKIFLLSDYHKNNRSLFLRMFGSDIINWSVDQIFLETRLLKDLDDNKAIFTSFKDRNLDLLVSIWINHIYPNNKNLKLFVTPNDNDNSNHNIFHRKFGNQKELINDLATSKVFLIPGHKAELYCIAAEEARELCIPIVTMGIGSLSDRVIHNKTGFIANSKKEFANYTLELFSNNNTWNEIRKNLISLRNSNNWEIATRNFLKKL